MALDLKTKYSDYDREIVPSRTLMTESGYRGGALAIPEDRTPVSIPGDYKFDTTSPGTVKPSSQAKFAFIPPDLGGGSYIIDPGTDGLVKSARPDYKNYTPERKWVNETLRNGIDSSRMQVDHILPLWAGGADTPYNLQGLTTPQHEIKTKISAVARTLYWNGEMTLAEAQNVAVNWKEKNIEKLDIPLVGDYDEVPLDLAREIVKVWNDPVKIGLSDVLKVSASRIPIVGKLVSKMFGYKPDKAEQMYEAELKMGPESDFGQVVQSFLSPLSLGFMPNPTGRGDEGVGTNIAKFGAHLAGFLASYGMFMKVINKVLATTKIGTMFAGASETGRIVGGLAKTGDIAKKNATALKAVAELQKASKLQAMVAKGLMSKPGQFLLTNQSGMRFLPGGARIGAMLTEAGLFGAFGQLQTPEVEETFSNRIHKFISDASYGAMLGTVEGAAIKDFAKIGFGTYMIGELEGLDTKDAMLNAVTMMGVHGMLSSGGTVANALGSASARKGSARVLQQVIDRNIYTAAKNTQARLTERVPNIRIPQITPGRAVTEAEYVKGLEHSWKEIDRKFQFNNDPIENKQNIKDASLLYKWLRMNSEEGATSYRQQSQDLMSQFMRLGERRPDNIESVPTWLQEYYQLAENEGIRLGSRPFPVTGTAPEGAPTGVMQITGTSTKLDSLAGANIRDALSGKPIMSGTQAMLIVREDVAPYFTRKNQLMDELVTGGKKLEEPTKNVQILIRDDATGEWKHAGWIGSTERIGAVVKDAEGKITGAAPEAAETSINKRIEIFNSTAKEGNERPYIDTERFNKNTIYDTLKSQGAEAAPANIILMGKAGVQSNEPYVVLNIDKSTYERSISREAIPRTSEEMIAAAQEQADIRAIEIGEEPVTAQEYMRTNLGGSKASSEPVAQLMDAIASNDVAAINNYNAKMIQKGQKGLLEFNEKTGDLTLNDSGVTKPTNRVTYRDLTENLNTASKKDGRLSKEGEKAFEEFVDTMSKVDRADFNALLDKPIIRPAIGEIPQKITLHSGARKGTETTIGKLAEAWGLGEKHYVSRRPLESRRPEAALKILDKGEANKHETMSLDTVRKLAEPMPKDPITLNNLQMDTHKIANAKQVIAIGEIAEGGQPKGATKYSIQMAKAMRREILFFDQVKKKWFKYNYEEAKWDKAAKKDVVINQEDFAGVGTIEINQAGLNALTELFTRSFPKGPKTKLSLVAKTKKTDKPQINEVLEFGEDFLVVPKGSPKASEEIASLRKEMSALEKVYRRKYLEPKDVKAEKRNEADYRIWVRKEGLKLTKAQETTRLARLLKLRSLGNRYTELSRLSKPEKYNRLPSKVEKFFEKRETEREFSRGELEDTINTQRRINKGEDQLRDDYLAWSQDKIELENAMTVWSKAKGLGVNEASEARSLVTKALETGDIEARITFEEKFGTGKELRGFIKEKLGKDATKDEVDSVLALAEESSYSLNFESADKLRKEYNISTEDFFAEKPQLLETMGYGVREQSVTLPYTFRQNPYLFQLPEQIALAAKSSKTHEQRLLWRSVYKELEKTVPKFEDGVLINKTFEQSFHDSFDGKPRSHLLQVQKLGNMINLSNVNFKKWTNKMPKGLREIVIEVKAKHPKAQLYASPKGPQYPDPNKSYNMFPKLTEYVRKSPDIDYGKFVERSKISLGEGREMGAAPEGVGKTGGPKPRSEKAKFYGGELTLGEDGRSLTHRQQKDAFLDALDKNREMFGDKRSEESEAAMERAQKILSRGMDQNDQGAILSSLKQSQSLIESEQGNPMSYLLSPLRNFKLNDAEIIYMGKQIANKFTTFPGGGYKQLYNVKRPKGPWDTRGDFTFDTKRPEGMSPKKSTATTEKKAPANNDTKLEFSFKDGNLKKTPAKKPVEVTEELNYIPLTKDGTPDTALQYSFSEGAVKKKASTKKPRERQFTAQEIKDRSYAQTKIRRAKNRVERFTELKLDAKKIVESKLEKGEITKAEGDAANKKIDAYVRENVKPGTSGRIIQDTLLADLALSTRSKKEVVDERAHMLRRTLNKDTKGRSPEEVSKAIKDFNLKKADGTALKDTKFVYRDKLPPGLKMSRSEYEGVNTEYQTAVKNSRESSWQKMKRGWITEGQHKSNLKQSLSSKKNEYFGSKENFEILLRHFKQYIQEK